MLYAGLRGTSDHELESAFSRKDKRAWISTKDFRCWIAILQCMVLHGIMSPCKPTSENVRLSNLTRRNYGCRSVNQEEKQTTCCAKVNMIQITNMLRLLFYNYSFHDLCGILVHHVDISFDLFLSFSTGLPSTWDRRPKEIVYRACVAHASAGSTWRSCSASI